jgi:hypothetical protein
MSRVQQLVSRRNATTSAGGRFAAIWANRIMPLANHRSDNHAPQLLRTVGLGLRRLISSGAAFLR